MTRDRKAKAVTLAILLGAFGIVLGQKIGWRMPERSQAKAEATPQDAIYAMLDAARAGDTKAYMRSYTGQMAALLKQSVSESTDAGFAKYLKDTNAAIKGVAISEPQPLTDREMKVRVEYVYQDRNEAQTMYLEKQPDGWKIARVDGAERVKTLVPYGTPVQ
ncbi:MAG: hypothetical protein M3Y07_16475 [Acidobacteriota bacterium]|nr:hypothetical protein [Acidobacteriota bacterium]